MRSKDIKPISEKIVATLPVPTKTNRRWYFSGSALSGKVAPSGFNVCVTPNGVKSFCLYRRGRQHTVGRWDKSPGGGDLSLIVGIVRAKDLATSLANGADPRPARTRRIEDGAAADGVETVARLIDHYLDRAKKERKDFRTFPQVERNLNRLVKPELGKIRALELRRKDIADAFDRIADISTPLMSDQALHHFAAAWRWASKRDDRLPSPFIAGMRRTNPEDHIRTRTLSENELSAVWAATGDGLAYSRYVRFLLLTGARRSEAMLFWSELDADGTWTLPASRNKVKFDLVRPLSKLALSQLVMNGEPRAFFFTNGKITRYHCALLKRSGTKDWRPHDARRVCRTLLSRVTSTEVTELALGHRRPTIERTYDQHKYIAELQQAYERLAQLIEQIANPKQNIVPMRAR
jgi:hypothetical protein